MATTTKNVLADAVEASNDPLFDIVLDIIGIQFACSYIEFQWVIPPRYQGLDMPTLHAWQRELAAKYKDMKMKVTQEKHQDILNMVMATLIYGDHSGMRERFLSTHPAFRGAFTDESNETKEPTEEKIDP